MREPLVFLNDHFLPQSQAHLPLHDAGFVMGATVTDLVRTFGHTLYRWPQHLERFRNSCRATSILPTLTDDQIATLAAELVRHNSALIAPKQDLALVLFATPGPIGYYLGETGTLGSAPVTFGMHTFLLPFARYRRWIEQGAALVVPNVRQVPATCVHPHIKMRSRLHWWLADREVQRIDPGAVALLLDERGELTETAAANVLLVFGGTVVSPPRANILEGISLAVVLELCGRLGIPFEERRLAVGDLGTAEEILLTSTPYGLVGVSRCNGAPVPWPGNVLQRLRLAWSDEIGIDIHEQIVHVS